MNDGRVAQGCVDVVFLNDIKRHGERAAAELLCQRIGVRDAKAGYLALVADRGLNERGDDLAISTAGTLDGYARRRLGYAAQRLSVKEEGHGLRRVGEPACCL